MRSSIVGGAVLALALTVACGDDGGDGRLVVNAFALEEARTGVTAEQTVDGFAVDFDHVVVELENFTARTASGDDAGLDPSPTLVELVPNAARVFEFPSIPARRWDEVGFDSRPPPPGVRLANAVDPDIVDRMIAEGWSQFYAGTILTPDGDEIPFELGFPVVSTYRRCRSGRDDTNGLVVPVSGVAEVEVTWHLTHLLFDSFAENSALRVEPIAAAWDGEGPLELADLATQPLADLRGLDGEPLVDEDGNPVLYIPPSSGAETLREHVLGSRFGHFDGLDGACTTEVVEVAR